jgi:hypothetical protein
MSTGIHRVAQRPPHVQVTPAAGRLEPERRPARQAERDAADQRSRRAQLLGSVLPEVQRQQPLRRRRAKAVLGVALGLIVLGDRLDPHGRKAALVLACVVVRDRVHIQAGAALAGAGLARPEGAEGLVEDLEVITVRAQRAAQRPVDVVALGGIDRGQRDHGVLQPPGTDLEAALPERPAEAHKPRDEVLAAHRA